MSGKKVMRHCYQAMFAAHSPDTSTDTFNFWICESQRVERKALLGRSGTVDTCGGLPASVIPNVSRDLKPWMRDIGPQLTSPFTAGASSRLRKEDPLVSDVQ